MAKDRPYSGDITDARRVASLETATPYDRLWQPFVACWSESHLLAAYGVHRRGKIDMGDIVCSVSTDGGDTWQPPTPIFVHAPTGSGALFAYANPVLYRPPDQDVVWCFAMRCPAAYGDSEDGALCGAYTADGGRTWHHVELTMHFHSPVITCAGVVRIARSQATRFLLPVHRNGLRHDPQGSQEQMVLESTGLMEWRLAGYVPRTGAEQVFAHEGGIAMDSASGELRIVMRTATAGRRYDALAPPIAYSSSSVDGGRTWSPITPEPALHNSASKAYYGCSAGGIEIYVYSPGPKGERKSLRYKLRRRGSDWGQDRLFYDGANRNSYPVLLEYAPGRFHAVWDSSDDPECKRTAIRYGRFSLDG